VKRNQRTIPRCDRVSPTTVAPLLHALQFDPKTLSALCPTDHGQSPLLHHPITLPCGHTLSSSHIIPSQDATEFLQQLSLLFCTRCSLIQSADRCTRGHIQAGRTTESTSMHSGIESMQSEVGEVPDFASGRGGDGIGGVGLPTSAPVGALDQTATRAEEERQLLEKLGRISSPTSLCIDSIPLCIEVDSVVRPAWMRTCRGELWSGMISWMRGG
jgi:hypothetical protein